MKDILQNHLYSEDLQSALNVIDLSSLSGKTILVTGGLGLVCSTVVDLIHEHNNRCDCKTTILIGDINEPFFKERYGSYEDIKFVKYNALESIDFDFEVDYIIHGAGLSSPELFMKKPVETMLSNFNGLLELLKYSKEHKVKKVLYISSSEVYGNKANNSSFKEDSFGVVDINTIRASYSESKRASELLCRSFSSEYDVFTVIVRPGHIYGPTASPKDQRVSSSFAFLAAQGKPLELKSSGLTKRSYCYSIDCAVAILLAILNGKSGESYNIGHDEVTSIKEMAAIYAEAGQVGLELVEPTDAELKSFNPMDNSSLNNEKIKKIGYKDIFSVRDGLIHTVKILRDIYFED